MKKRLFMKINNVLLLAIFAFLSISIPSVLMVYADKEGNKGNENCVNGCIQYIDTKFGDNYMQTKGSQTQDLNKDYINWNTHTGAKLTIGNQTIYLDEGDFGMPPTINYDRSANSEYKDWSTNAMAEWDAYVEGSGGKTPIVEKLESLVLENGYASMDDYRNDLAKKGNIFDIKIFPGLYLADVGSDDYKLITTDDRNTELYQKAANSWEMSRAIDSNEKTCGLGFHGYGVCGGTDLGNIKCPPNEDPHEPAMPDIPTYTCDSPVPPIPTVPSRTDVPSDINPSSSCDGMYISVSYKVISSSCPYITLLQQSTTSASLPGMSGTILAGKGFNFSDTVTVSSSTSYSLYDKSALINATNSMMATIAKIESDIDCITKAINELERKKAEYIRKEIAACPSCEDIIKEGKLVGEDCTNRHRCEDQVYENAKAFDHAIEEKKQELAEKLIELNYANEQLKELQTCEANAMNGFNSSSNSTTHEVVANMTIDEYRQTMNSIKGVSKGTGTLLTKNEIEKLDSSTYVEINNSFVVPASTQNGVDGTVDVTISSLTSYSCPFDVVNLIKCKDGDCENPNPVCTEPPCLDDPIHVNSGGLALIYKPISLTNPFPNISNPTTYRQMGLNWNANLADIIIKNNRGVSDYEVYNQTPIYTITLTPAKIKEIREYNKRVSYNNFDMNCSNGYLCSSNFLWDTSYGFNDIISQDESCATENNWDNCYGGGN